jgi:hypothetical protein
VRGYGGLVCPHLPEQQRLQESPSRNERVPITHGLPKLKRPQHVTIDVDVARQIRIGELDLIKTGDGAHRVPVLQPDTEARRALPKTSDSAIRKIHIERHTCLTKPTRDAIKPKPASGDSLQVRSATLRPDSDFLRHAAASASPIPSNFTGTLST